MKLFAEKNHLLVENMYDLDAVKLQRFYLAS